MRARTRGTLLSRLERLEFRTEGRQPLKVRLGQLRRLPQDYKGERHRVIAKHLPDRPGQGCVEWEEVPGPDPNPPQESDCLDIVFVSADPEQPLGELRIMDSG